MSADAVAARDARTRSALAATRTWDAAEKQAFRDAGWWTDETLAGHLEERARRHADRPALVGRDAQGAERRWSYRELADQVAGAAARLSDLGLAPADRVVVALPNVVENLVVVLALLRIGVVPVLALPSHREVELTQFCAVADAEVLVVLDGTDGVDHRALHAEVSRRVEAEGVRAPRLLDVANAGLLDVPPGERAPVAERPADEIALLQLSGGTTGVAKLVPRTSADYLCSVRAAVAACGSGPDDVVGVVLPLSHNFTLSSPGVLGALDVGACVVLVADPSPRTGLATVAREGVTTVALVPPLAQAWLAYAERRGSTVPSLCTVQVGGSRLPDAVARRVAPVLGARLQQVFGMAEGLVCYTRDTDPDDVVCSTQGLPSSPGDEVRLVDADGRTVLEGAEGELETRGPYTIRGYYRSPAADAEQFTADGFYRTGDLVRRHPTGHLEVTGRVKDQINRGGEKVATAELESHVLTHPDVLDVVAVGVPDPLLGESVALVVVPVPGRPAPDDVVEHLRRAGLAPWKLPDVVHVRDRLPLTHVGKTSRRDVRRALLAELTSHERTTPDPAVPDHTTHTLADAPAAGARTGGPR